MTSDDQRLAILDCTVEQIGKTGTGVSVRDFNRKPTLGSIASKALRFALTVFPLPAVNADTTQVGREPVTRAETVPATISRSCARPAWAYVRPRATPRA
ncbi:MAG TPA: hypothetical protein VJT32_09930 [bacterium]|nr:hypothetical protein [bacterium]